MKTQQYCIMVVPNEGMPHKVRTVGPFDSADSANVFAEHLMCPCLHQCTVMVVEMDAPAVFVHGVAEILRERRAATSNN